MTKAMQDRFCPRGETVVNRVLLAALAALGKVGYGALSVEKVARDAKVNKTTVYRRWPCKSDLVRAAFVAAATHSIGEADTGTLRGDLLHLCRSHLDFARSAEGKAILRTLLGGQMDSDVHRFVVEVRKSKEAQMHKVFDRAVQRGEIAAETDTQLLTEMLIASIHLGSLLGTKVAQPDQLEHLVDQALHGVLTEAARQAPVVAPVAAPGPAVKATPRAPRRKRATAEVPEL